MRGQRSFASSKGRQHSSALRKSRSELTPEGTCLLSPWGGSEARFAHLRKTALPLWSFSEKKSIPVGTREGSSDIEGRFLQGRKGVPTGNRSRGGGTRGLVCKCNRGKVLSRKKNVPIGRKGSRKFPAKYSRESRFDNDERRAFGGTFWPSAR